MGKKEYKSKMLSEMKLKKADEKLFWKLLDKLDTSRNNDIFKNNIPHRKWNNHFKSIFSDGNSDNSKLPLDCTQKGPLDGEISMTELHKTTYILKLNKASGYDVICNEMMLCLYQTQTELLLKLFNNVFNEAGRIEQWAVSMVTPLFKSGSRGARLIIGGFQ